ncbi:unnamed protein product (macronuclear) [Paramecium tetraurelia]|uniref:Jacalin-type lectin domain-containing protein n=1 Tax=Paramecium tetraurelia TaxID=5888 RepID=A0E763_PARTE|nr:uncharacterized protein GSPATT00023858001 [Paramecium tetraurelia]CAK91130.1 unnamed protein product [Paramecium tetraurelia]|eukprot:XP_001458527.1 hypothetical protein (macronuclear) [Paramecium tetraurelia strain d4-2]
MELRFLSVGQSQGEDFDDGMIDKISKVKIQYNKQNIVAIALFYDKRQMYKFHNFCCNAVSKFYFYVQEEEFIIEKDDCKYIAYLDLQQVSGTFDGRYITSLQFATYNGQSAHFKASCLGNQFYIENFGDTFSSCSGSFDTNGLTSLSFKVIPLNSTDQERIQNTILYLSYGSHYPQQYIPQFSQFLNYPQN